MRSDRELMELAKTKTLETIAKQFRRSPEAILKRASRLGISIRRASRKEK
jgi:hypothetical protein